MHNESLLTRDLVNVTDSVMCGWCNTCIQGRTSCLAENINIIVLEGRKLLLFAVDSVEATKRSRMLDHIKMRGYERKKVRKKERKMEI